MIFHNWLASLFRSTCQRSITCRRRPRRLVTSIEAVEARVLLSAVTWTAQGSGNFGDANNWTPAEVPNGAEYEITFNAGSPVVSFKDGAGDPFSPISKSVSVTGEANVEFSIEPGHAYTLERLTVDSFGPGLRITGGSIAGDSLSIEVGLSATGELDVVGSNVSARDLFIGRGADGSGIVVVHRESHLSVNNELLIGQLGAGSLTVNGESTVEHLGITQVGSTEEITGALSVFGRSVLASDAVEIVHGIVDISDSGWLVSEDMVVGRFSDSTVFVKFSGELLVGGTLQVGDNLHQDVEHSAHLIVTGITAQGRSTVDAEKLLVGGTQLPGFDVGEGTLTIREGGLVEARTVIIGPNSVIVDQDGSAKHSVTVSGAEIGPGGQVLQHSELRATQQLIVGDAGTGRLNIEGGDVISTGGTSYLGKAGGIGVVTVVGGAEGLVAPVALPAKWDTAELLIGSQGDGTLKIQAGDSQAKVSSTSSTVGVGTGLVEVEGNGAEWELTGNLTVNSNGTVTIKDAGKVTSGSGNVGTESGPAKVTVDGENSLWKATGDIQVGGPSAEGTLEATAQGNVEATVIHHKINGRLVGDGFMRANIVVNYGEGAWILPGFGESSIATLTFDADWNATGGMTLFVDIAGVGNHDVLDVTGNALLGGIVDVNFFGAAPALGDRFEVVTVAGSVSGTVEAENLPPLDTGLMWYIDYSGGIALEVVEEPSADGDPEVDEGSEFKLTLTSGAPVDEWIIDWGDGSSPEIVPGDPANEPLEVKHVYANGPDEITILVEAVIGGESFWTDHDLTVNNVDPELDGMQLSPSGVTIYPGDEVTVSGWFSDPAFDYETYTVTVDWGDEFGWDQFEPLDDQIEWKYSYSEAGLFLVVVTIEDGDGGEDTWDQPIEISQVTAVISGDSSVEEGSEYVLMLQSNVEVSHWEIDWGEAGGWETYYPADIVEGTVSYTYADGQDHQVWIEARAWYNDFSYDADSLVVTVENVDPELRDMQLSPIGVIYPGDPVDVSGWFSDPAFGHETYTFTVNWGDGTVEEDLSPWDDQIEREYSYSEAGVYMVVVTIYDGDGGTDTWQQPIEIAQVTAVISGDLTVEEGADYILTLESNADVSHWEVNWGDGGGWETYYPWELWNDTLWYTYEDGWDHQVTIQARAWYEDYSYDADPLEVTIENVDPELHDMQLSPTGVIYAGDPVDVSGWFSDPAFGHETYTFTVNWGDGTVEEDLSPWDDQIEREYSYSEAGAYMVVVTIYDGDGGTDTWNDTVEVTSGFGMLSMSSNSEDEPEDDHPALGRAPAAADPRDAVWTDRFALPGPEQLLTRLQGIPAVPVWFPLAGRPQFSETAQEEADQAALDELFASLSRGEDPDSDWLLFSSAMADESVD